MCKICPQCGAIAEFNAYYGRVTCTRCNWESEKRGEEKSNVDKAIEYCEQLMEMYDRNIDIDDVMIAHMIEILKGRE